jgi:Ala-tRNA(Pro) deacylase
MPILKRLKEVLDDAKVDYEVCSHALAYTAQEIAQRQHVPGKAMAKVVIVRADGAYVMAVMPASRMLNLARMKAAINTKQVALATEAEFTKLFPGCEIGAMPPFGNLFGLPVYVDSELEKDETIFFNAGNHVQTVRLRYQDFKALVQPVVVSLTEERRQKAA